MPSLKKIAKRSVLNTTIRADILESFKQYCLERDYQMNTIIEMCMEAFVREEFVLKISKGNKLEVDLKEDNEG